MNQDPWVCLPSKRPDYKPTHKYTLSTPKKRQQSINLSRNLSSTPSETTKATVASGTMRKRRRSVKKKPPIRKLPKLIVQEDCVDKVEGDDNNGGKDEELCTPSNVVKDTVRKNMASRRKRRKIITLQGKLRKNKAKLNNLRTSNYTRMSTETVDPPNDCPMTLPATDLSSHSSTTNTVQRQELPSEDGGYDWTILPKKRKADKSLDSAVDKSPCIMSRTMRKPKSVKTCKTKRSTSNS